MDLLRRTAFVVALHGLLGCASTVDGGASLAEAGAQGSDAAAGGDACAQWVLTDRETRNAGELHTDLHLTFDDRGRLATRRENVRTGGHGKNRTSRGFTYQWSDSGLTVTQDDHAEERTVYELRGERLIARARESAEASLRRSVRWERDAAGRVVARIETGAEPDRCDYDYDPAGRLTRVECREGELSRYQWDGDRPVRRDRSWRGRYPGFDTWEWDARGALLRERHDDGYGPGRLYRNDHTYDPAGRLLRTESVTEATSARHPVAAFGYDDRGRLAREERDFDPEGVARTVARWERDGEGRVVARLTAEGVVTRFAYEVAPARVEVTETSGEWRSWRRYRCFATPVRVAPADPTPGVAIASVYPEVERFPANPLEP